MLKLFTPRVGLDSGLHPWPALVSALALAFGCGGGGGDAVESPPPIESVPWVGPAPELRIVAGPDGMHLVAAKSALQSGVRVHAVHSESGEGADGTANDDGSLNLLVPGGNQDDYEVTLRKVAGVQRPQEAVLTRTVPSLEETEAALGPCNCADVHFPHGGNVGIVHQPLECLPGFCTEPGCYPKLDAWQAELCAQPANGAILRWSGCGLVEFDFALGSDARGAFGNDGNPFYSFDAESQELVGFYHYSDSHISCELASTAGWSTGDIIYGQAIGGPGRECAEASACIVCGSEPGIDGPTCAD